MEASCPHLPETREERQAAPGEVAMPEPGSAVGGQVQAVAAPEERGACGRCGDGHETSAGSEKSKVGEYVGWGDDTFGRKRLLGDERRY